MKKTLFVLLISILGISFNSKVQAYDFSAVNITRTYYFNIISSTAPYTVELTSYSNTYPYNTTQDYLATVIPDTVVFNAITYAVVRIGDNAF